ncbi:unconventional myosin-VIIa-like [Sardina pilchardus]|uniref:unconventional myosin-VIIa-like n=1 Tax=Sardina pilchardus TaxID=27697 RepID=UPI002E0FE90C
MGTGSEFDLRSFPGHTTWSHSCVWCVSSVSLMHPTSVEGVADMIRLGDLNEAGLLRNLQLRHKQGFIYTYIGSVLVAVNPYELLPIYTAEQVHRYHGRQLGELPPHVFAIADSCYFNMRRNRLNQCCIISGESGAGKTESTKLMLQFLAAVSGQHSWIEQQILEANPILEAFGNAKTIRNDNSSRFGKYIEIFFNKKGVIEGAHMEQYLLEKSRVCHQASNERNYHIFYCLLLGLPKEQKKILSLGKAEDYKYLQESGCISCEGRDDASDYTRIRSALKILTFGDRECWDIFKMLAAILHMGNIDFQGSVMENMDSSSISASNHYTMSAKLLEVDNATLDVSLTRRTFSTNRERVSKSLSSDQARDTRDAFAKAIYSKMFLWLFEKINVAIHKVPSKGTGTGYQSIGLLDIFGFENFVSNSFEQLCINYANEQLQQFFVRHVFKLEQEEYTLEDISWQRIIFTDNQPALDLLALKPMNILSLIDEESHFPKGTDITMLTKMNKVHKQSKTYIAAKSDHEFYFGIQHFAGAVYYDPTGFLEKNRDALSSDLMSLVQKSSNKLLHLLFEKELNQVNEAHRGKTTLSSQYRQSLDTLMKALSVCQPHFIRCFKPNHTKAAKVFDRELCMRQLRDSGMLETIRIRKSGYPIRHTFREFLGRYRVLLNTTHCDPHTLFLGVTRLQACVRGRHDRQQYERRRAAAVTLQTQTRGLLCRRSYTRQKQAAILLQRHIRGALARKTAHRLRTDAFLSEQERLAREQTALELQRRLQDVLDQSQAASSKPEPISEQKLVKAAFDFLPEKKHEVETEEEEEEEEEGGLPMLVSVSQIRERVEEPAPGEERDETEQRRSVKRGVERQKSVKREEAVAAETVIVSYAARTLTEPGEEEDGREEFSFSRFCAQYFQSPATDSHSPLRLRKPLLLQEDEGDALACVSVWWIILRFMGDLPEPKAIVSISPTNSQPNLGRRQDRRLSSLVGLDQPDGPSTSAGNDIMIGEGPTLHRTMTSLEKLHIIVGYALSRPGIRDEIFCQICKQLTGNRNELCRKRGWILMAICLGIFPPTDLFMRYLRNFVRQGPPEYSSYCMERLRRTLTNGARGEPACWVELEACRSKKPVQVKVSLPDGRSLKLQVDSASTSGEICSCIAKETGIRDDFGFSLYIAMHDKMWSLGSKGLHLMDSVFQCEQEVRRQGDAEESAPWRLSFRKELFPPWPHPLDPAATDLTYSQVISSLQSGEYQSDKWRHQPILPGLQPGVIRAEPGEDDFVQLAAMHYFVRFGSDSSTEKTKQVVRECINTNLIESKSEPRWIQMVTAAHTQGRYIKSQKSTTAVKQELLDYTRRTWPMFFSRFFEVTYKTGAFEEDSSTVISMSTLRGDITMVAEKGVEFVEMVGGFLDGLKQRSTCGVALQEAYKQDNPMYLDYRRGDILLLHRDDEFSQESGWMSATNERTGQRAAISTDAIMFLPTMSRPTDDTLNLLNLNPAQKKSKDELPTDRVTLINLKEFSFEHFSLQHLEAKDSYAKVLFTDYSSALNTVVPSRLPLHTAVCSLTFAPPIMKYMGDYPVKHVRSPLELTNQIFGPPTQHPELRDEIYCQIMKQLTNNNNGMSLERGWQLLWLCCGLFPPSDSLLKHTQRFIESRPREPLSAPSLQRLRGMLSLTPRLLPPHQVEVDAILQNSTQLYHKVHFPNDSTEIFEVTATTKICDLCRQIASHLRLNSGDGYSLFVKTTSKVLSLDDQQYFFDNLRQTTDQPTKNKKEKKSKEGLQLITPYLVLFMRKLWFNVVPGKDVTADVIFHFPQERPKYLRGYHNCSREDVVTLAGLLFRVKVDSDRSQFVMIPRMLKELLPDDQIKLMSPDDWKKNIISSYNKQAGISVEEAKVSFLRHISAWPTFGCVFFEVKQTSDRSLPSIIRIAISKQGVSIINPKNKEQLTMHPFSQITNWSSGSTYFHMTLGNLVKGNTLLCETSMGYKIEDLLSSYVEQLLCPVITRLVLTAPLLCGLITLELHSFFASSRETEMKAGSNVTLHCTLYPSDWCHTHAHNYELHLSVLDEEGKELRNSRGDQMPCKITVELRDPNPVHAQKTWRCQLTARGHVRSSASYTIRVKELKVSGDEGTFGPLPPTPSELKVSGDEGTFGPLPPTPSELKVSGNEGTFGPLPPTPSELKVSGNEGTFGPLPPTPSELKVSGDEGTFGPLPPTPSELKVSGDEGTFGPLPPTPSELKVSGDEGTFGPLPPTPSELKVSGDEGTFGPLPPTPSELKVSGNEGTFGPLPPTPSELKVISNEGTFGPLPPTSELKVSGDEGTFGPLPPTPSELKVSGDEGTFGPLPPTPSELKVSGDEGTFGPLPPTPSELKVSGDEGTFGPLPPTPSELKG